MEVIINNIGRPGDKSSSEHCMKKNELCSFWCFLDFHEQMERQKEITEHYVDCLLKLSYSTSLVIYKCMHKCTHAHTSTTTQHYYLFSGDVKVKLCEGFILSNVYCLLPTYLRIRLDVTIHVCIQCKYV